MKVLYIGVFTGESTNIGQAKALDKISDLSTLDMRDIGTFSLQQRDNAIIKIVKEDTPDLLLISKGNTISVKVLQEARKYCKVACWYMDPLVNADLEWMEKVKNSDYIFSAYEHLANVFRETNKNSFYLQEGFDPDIHRPIKTEKKYDTVFIGTIKDGFKQHYQQECNFKICNDAYGSNYSLLVNQTRINLGFTTNGEGTSDRAYKVLACGGFYMTDKWKYIENDWEVGKDLIVFDSVIDFKDKERYFLKNNNERHEIAEHGRKTVQKYSVNNWATTIINTVQNG